MKTNNLFLAVVILLVFAFFAHSFKGEQSPKTIKYSIPTLEPMEIEIDNFNTSVLELRKEQKEREFLLSLLDAKVSDGYYILDSIIIK